MKSRQIKSKKDFAWHMAKRNPMMKEMSVDRIQKIQIFLILVSVITTAALLLYHPYFNVNKVKVTGLQRIPQRDFTDSVLGAINFKRFLFIPANSYIGLNTKELQEIIQVKYALSNIEIKKEFPDGLNIIVEEELSTVIYDNSHEYVYLSPEGNVVEILKKIGDEEWNIEKKMVSSTNEDGEIFQEEIEVARKHVPLTNDVINDFGDYPIVYDSRNKEANLNSNVLKKETVRAILDWYNILRKNNNNTDYFFIDNELGEIYIYMRDNWYIKAKTDTVIADQFTALSVLLDQRIGGMDFEYVDLRYGDRIYWQ